MTGVRCPCDCNASCNSRPLNPGICRSVIRHVVFAITSDPRKCSADVKVMMLYPKDSTSAAMPSRASESSSTIEINGTSDISTSVKTKRQCRSAIRHRTHDPQTTFKEFDLYQVRLSGIKHQQSLGSQSLTIPSPAIPSRGRSSVSDSQWCTACRCPLCAKSADIELPAHSDKLAGIRKLRYATCTAAINGYRLRRQSETQLQSWCHENLFLKAANSRRDPRQYFGRSRAPDPYRSASS